MRFSHGLEVVPPQSFVGQRIRRGQALGGRPGQALVHRRPGLLAGPRRVGNAPLRCLGPAERVTLVILASPHRLARQHVLTDHPGHGEVRVGRRAGTGRYIADDPVEVGQRAVAGRLDPRMAAIQTEHHGVTAAPGQRRELGDVGTGRRAIRLGPDAGSINPPRRRALRNVLRPTVDGTHAGKMVTRRHLLDGTAGRLGHPGRRCGVLRRGHSVLRRSVYRSRMLHRARSMRSRIGQLSRPGQRAWWCRMTALYSRMGRRVVRCLRMGGRLWRDLRYR